MLETRLDRLVSEKVEQLLNAMLDAEADEITGAARYERTGDRKAYRAGHYERDLTVKAGTVTLRGPKLKGALFESAVIERYRRREQSVEEALIDMYLAGVSTRQVDDISRLLWGERMPSQTLSDKLKGVYAQIDEWRNRPLERSYPYLFVDGVWHKRTWGGSVENVSVLVAIGVDDTGHREVVGVAEGMKEDRASWEQFVRSLIERGLRGVRLVVGDRCAGLVATVNSMLPDARYQRCTVHFMRNVLSRVSRKHAAWAAGALKAVFAMESRDAALRKAEDVAAQMESRGLKAAASCLREGIGESTTYLLDDYPVEHRRRIRTNNMIERLNREIRRRTCISSSRCFVFSHVFFSGLGSCMHFPYFSGCAEVFLPNMRASLTRRLWPVNSRSRPWCTMRSMIAAASLSSAKTVPHLLNSMFVVNMMLRLS